MKFYRTNTVLSLSTWDEKTKTFLELTPARDGASKGQPKPGEKRYDYDRTVRISFQVSDMLIAAYHFLGLAHGQKMEYSKFADPSKSPHGNGAETKSLKVFLGDKGGVFVGLTQGSTKLAFTLTFAEAYAIGKWFEIQAQKYVAGAAEYSSEGDAAQE